MLGAIIGDTVGSVYEFHNTKNYSFELFDSRSSYTDDSVMSMAVAYWLIKDPNHTYEALEDIMVQVAKFDYIVSNPPFNLDFSGYSETLKIDGMRFGARVPDISNKKKDSMAIYLCFIQHVIYSLKPGGRAAIVVPTGFVIAKNGIAHNIIKKLVDQHWLLGVVSMPSNIFATTGANVSVLFIHKEDTPDRQVIMIDASKLGKEVREGKNKKTQLQPDEITRIVSTFKSRTSEDGFSVSVFYNDIIAKSYMLSSGYYFDVHIDPVDITPEAFAAHMTETTAELESLFSKSHDLEKILMDNLMKLKM